jgi:histone acetyltransferase (RNA polymerase elongator complex component)
MAHSIKSMADGTSIATSLAKCGIHLLWNNYAVEHEPRRTATALMLPKTVFNENSENVLKLYDAIVNSRYSNTTTTKNGAMKPVHDDEIADFRSALENAMVNVGRIFRHQRKETSSGKMNEEKGFINNLISYLKS